MKPINVFSMFDGMSCGTVGIKKKQIYQLKVITLVRLINGQSK